MQGARFTIFASCLMFLYHGNFTRLSSYNKYGSFHMRTKKKTIFKINYSRIILYVSTYASHNQILVLFRDNSLIPGSFHKMVLCYTCQFFGLFTQQIVTKSWDNIKQKLNPCSVSFSFALTHVLFVSLLQSLLVFSFVKKCPPIENNKKSGQFFFTQCP